MRGESGGLKVRGFVLGEKQLEDALKQLPKATGKSVLRRALKTSAKPTVEKAKQYVSVDEGDLRTSIHADTRLYRTQKSKRLKRGAVELFIGAGWPQGAHAHLIEFGTSLISAFPWLQPAWEGTKKKVLGSIEEEIWKPLAKSAKTLAKKAAKGTLSKSARRALAQRR